MLTSLRPFFDSYGHRVSSFIIAVALAAHAILRFIPIKLEHDPVTTVTYLNERHN